MATEKTRDSNENPENNSYAHKHEKYPNGYYHKIFNKPNSQKYSANWNPTKINVVLHFPEVLWGIAILRGGNSVPQKDKK